MKKKITNLVLTGFMGSGKSSAAKKLSHLLHYDLVVLDKQIEDFLKMPVNDIFDKKGEQFFREVEATICKTASEKSRTVIDTGGGVVKNQNNIAFLKQSGIIVYLKADASHIFNNLKNDDKRPLLNNKRDDEKMAAIAELLAERLPLYEQSADFTVNVSNRSIEQISNEIFDIFKEEANDFSR